MQIPFPGCGDRKDTNAERSAKPEKPEPPEKERKAGSHNCESCEFYEDDEEYGPSCALSLDEDEFADFVNRDTGNCPYYRFYDEYQTVRHQN